MYFTKHNLPLNRKQVIANGGHLTEHFMLREFDCHDGTPIPDELISNVALLAINLEVIRAEVGSPLHVNSGYRTPTYNKKVGGVPGSQHLLAKASDITCKTHSPKQLADLILRLMTEGKIHNGGLGRYPGFTHYDIRKSPSRWTL